MTLDNLTKEQMQWYRSMERQIEDKSKEVNSANNHITAKAVYGLLGTSMVGCNLAYTLAQEIYSKPVDDPLVLVATTAMGAGLAIHAITRVGADFHKWRQTKGDLEALKQDPQYRTIDEFLNGGQ